MASGFNKDQFTSSAEWTRIYFLTDTLIRQPPVYNSQFDHFQRWLFYTGWTAVIKYQAIIVLVFQTPHA